MDERIERAIAGCRDALTDLLVERHDALLRFLEFKMSPELRGQIEAGDLLQETMIAAFRGIGSFQPKNDRAFDHWLETIAENRLRDAAKAIGSQKRGGEFSRVPAEVKSDTGSMLNLLEVVAAELSTPSLKVSREEGIRALQICLAGLPEDYREAITLKDLQGLSLEETAARMSRPADEVRGLLYRGRKKLADDMGGSSLYQFRG